MASIATEKLKFDSVLLVVLWLFCIVQTFNSGQIHWIEPLSRSIKAARKKWFLVFWFVRAEKKMIINNDRIKNIEKNDHRVGHDDLFPFGHSFFVRFFFLFFVLVCLSSIEQKNGICKWQHCLHHITWTYRLILQLWQQKTCQHLQKQIDSV